MGVIIMSNARTGKPIVTNLTGRAGKLFGKEMRSATPPDFTQVEIEVKQLKEKILASKKDGTF